LFFIRETLFFINYFVDLKKYNEDHCHNNDYQKFDNYFFDN